MFAKLLQVLSITCRHRHTSKPFSTASTASSRNPDWDSIASSGHYVVCLDCGQKFDYDWGRMQLVRKVS